MTQRETILQLLNQAEWVCGTQFQNQYIPEYRTRINELRKDGFTVEARRCIKHPHKGIMQEWSLKTKAYHFADHLTDPEVIEKAIQASNQAQRDIVRASQELTPKDDINPVQEKTPRIDDSVASQPKARGWAYYPPEPPKVCCEIYKASKGYAHARGCETQK